MQLYKKILLFLTSVTMAALLQVVVGVALIEYSSWAYPHEVSSVGTLGFAITPHPLAFGLYLLPFTAWGICSVLKSCFKNYSCKNNSVKKINNNG